MRRPARGFTLIELMVTLALVAILAAVAMPSFKTTFANQAVSNAASELMTAGLQARSTALKENRQVVLEPTTAGDWRDGWRIYVDMNQNLSFDSGSDTLVVTHEALDSKVSVAAGALTQIAYRSDGFLYVGGALGNGRITLQATNTTRTKIIIVDRPGRVRICDTRLSPGCDS